jgi:hypothetical protein
VILWTWFWRQGVVTSIHACIQGISHRSVSCYACFAYCTYFLSRKTCRKYELISDFSWINCIGCELLFLKKTTRYITSLPRKWNAFPVVITGSPWWNLYLSYLNKYSCNTVRLILCYFMISIFFSYLLSLISLCAFFCKQCHVWKTCKGWKRVW